jgi:Domain of unknown function (DUF4394)
MLRKLTQAALMGALAVTCFTASAQAGWIIGLIDGKSIVTIDPATRKVSGKTDIKGVTNVVGIDVRPADGVLYGLTHDGWVVTIDVKSGQATQKSKLSEMLKPGNVATVDFNPVADRLRVIGSDGTSLRANVDDGKVTVDGSLKFKEGDANAGKTPKVIAGAYSNAMKSTPSTTLYDIDSATGSLVTQAPPNDGILNTVGALGISLAGPVAFNIVSAGERNDAWLAAGGDLYSVDLKTGKATMAGHIEGLPGKLTDMAWTD